MMATASVSLRGQRPVLHDLNFKLETRHGEGSSSSQVVLGAAAITGIIMMIISKVIFCISMRCESHFKSSFGNVKAFNFKKLNYR